MHRFASFLSGIVLSPGNWILVLLLLILLVKNKTIKRRLGLSCVIVFMVFSSPLLISWFGHAWQWPRSEIDTSKHYSCGIVLGGFASMDADNYAYFNGAADRFIQVLKMYKLGVINRVMISGGNGRKQGKNFSEAVFIKQELQTMGVPDSCIFSEDESANTADNARNCKRLLDSLKLVPPYLLITSASHIRRAKTIFERQQLPVVPFACNYSGSSKPFSFWMLIPSFEALNDWNGYLKESVGYWWYR